MQNDLPFGMDTSVHNKSSGTEYFKAVFPKPSRENSKVRNAMMLEKLNTTIYTRGVKVTDV